jgi:hypothetical protein
MHARSLERVLAAASLLLVLVVIAASAAIRLGSQDLGGWLPVVRGTHRVSASLATLLIAAVAILAWRGGRRPLAAAIAVVTVFLSALGAATGIGPPPWAQAGNLLGGLLLAGLLAWLLGAKEPAQKRLWALVALQASLGAWIAIFAEELWTPVLLTHVALGIGLAALIAWLAIKRNKPVLLLLALAVPASGAAAALFGLPLAAMIAHSAAVALLVSAAAYVHAGLA